MHQVREPQINWGKDEEVEEMGLVQDVLVEEE